MEDILYQLTRLLEDGKPSQETLSMLQKCISMFIAYDDSRYIVEQLPAFLEDLLASVIKPLFASTAKPSVSSIKFLDNPRKPWKDSAPWSVDVLNWILDQYGILKTPLQKQAIESQIPLLVPPIFALLDDDDLTQKKLGCDLLQVLCIHIANCGSGILERTGLLKVFDDSLAHNMLLLPSLTPEDQSLKILSSLYPAYRALVKASFPANSSAARSDTGKLIAVAPERILVAGDVLEQHHSRQAMLDKILSGGILAGYIHASDYVQIATLLVSEIPHVVTMMGASSTKYLSRLLPLLHSILTNPLGLSFQPLLRPSITAMRELILQCWPRIAEVWWEECLRAVIGFWFLLSEDDSSVAQIMRDDAKGLMNLLLQVKGQSETRRDLSLLEAIYGEVEGLVSVGRMRT